MADKTLVFTWIPAHSFRRGRIRPIRNIVLHSSDGHERGDIDTLTNGEVSSHWYVTRSGKLYHFVKDEDTAFHAGRVSDNLLFSNSATIGIEQEHRDHREDWPDAQVEKVAQLTAYLLQTHNLRNRSNIKTHAEIAAPRGRKEDPVGYPFDRFYSLVDQFLNDRWTIAREGREGAALENLEFVEAAENERVPAERAFNIEAVPERITTFSATKARVFNRGVPPNDFLHKLVAWAKNAPDDIFQVNDNHDIYSNVVNELGPYTGLRHRKAAMMEVLRVLGGFESSWDFNEGRDITNSHSNTPCTEEAGIFQCSGNSMNFDSSLRALVEHKAGSTDCAAFIRTTKTDHEFAFEYCARLLRFTVNHHGPVKRREINSWLSRDAMTELQLLLDS